MTIKEDRNMEQFFKNMIDNIVNGIDDFLKSFLKEKVDLDALANQCEELISSLSEKTVKQEGVFGKLLPRPLFPCPNYTSNPLSKHAQLFRRKSFLRRLYTQPKA